MTLNATASRSAKEHGMQIALDFAGEEWKDRALTELRAWCAAQWAAGNSEMTMEQFRTQAANQPPRHHAWGPLAVMACKAGIIQAMEHPDGSPVMRRAESVRTHAHPVRVYKIRPSFASSGAAKTDSHTVTVAPCAAGVDGENSPSNVGEIRHSHCAEAA